MLALAAALLGLWLAAAAPARADELLTLEAYRRIVADAAALMDRAFAENRAEPQQALLTEAAAKLAGARIVQMDDGTRVAVDNTALTDEVRDARNAGRVRDARTRVQALRDAVNALPGPAVSADDAARLKDIYSRPPFKTDAPPDNPFVQQILELLFRLLDAIARGIFEAREIAVVVGVLIVLAVAAYFLISLRRQSAGDAQLPPDPSDPEAGLTAGQALSNAQRLAAAGDYRTAVRQLYLSTLLWLDEHGRLKYDRALTNREYLRVLSGAPALRDALAPVVETFDRIWYGFAPISAAEFERYRQDVDALRRP